MKSRSNDRNSPLSGPGDFRFEQIRAAFGIPGIRSSHFLESLPFCGQDVTAGTENELQTAVLGKRENVDLAITIDSSNYYANIAKRTLTGDSPRNVITELEKYLEHQNQENLWENSWVRFPVDALSKYALEILNLDLLSNRSNPLSKKRSDSEKFFCVSCGSAFIRTPVSYLLKLALADAIGSQPEQHNLFLETGEKLLNHFLNDNTSPETFSFHVVRHSSQTSIGTLLAREAHRRNLLTQLLILYANRKFRLEEYGQKAVVYFSPHPPVRQKELNECISDSFYRELFMSPCLSGWDEGEAKCNYMSLCHQTMSRSQMNAVAKMRDAGIITRNLVVLPTVSNISLANNGTHISIGSQKLTRNYEQIDKKLGNSSEKLLGDLVIKVIEHFLPLFVGTYSAAPYRIDYSDFHPEKMLGFLPHQLDFTHLRMLWRRWKKKASISIFGSPMTPFGIKSLDHALSVIFRTKGDFVHDYRLIDYLVCLMSTDRSPALDGKAGNEQRLKKDLESLGVFDSRMSLYLLYRLREISRHGYSGFEGRHYSLFEDLETDMANAADLQILLTALAFKYIFEGRVNHNKIPDDPFVESERRQIFFCVAVGIPTFYVWENTSNVFLAEIVKKTDYLRYSRRYRGYLRVLTSQYLKVLFDTVIESGSGLIEMMGLENAMGELRLRLESPQHYSAQGKLTKGILSELDSTNALKVSAREFNLAAEKYYRNTLREKCLRSGLDLMEQELSQLDSQIESCDPKIKYALATLTKEHSSVGFLSSVKNQLITEEIDVDRLRKVINLVLLLEANDNSKIENQIRSDSHNQDVYESIHNQRYGTA